MQLRQAILSTLSYHSKFNYPLTLDELHRFLLINRPISSNELKPEVNELIKNELIQKDGDFYLLTRTTHPRLTTHNSQLTTLRNRRAIVSAPKLRLARRAARLIGFLPWIKLVCVTGSLAMENSDETDDIDLMIVTSPNRLWLTRPLVVIMTSLIFKRRRPHPHSSTHNPQHTTHNNELCLNLWLDSSTLAMPPHRQNLLTAHELAQMKPLINKNFTYEKMLSLNKWGAKLLANFWSTIQQFNNLAINNQQSAANNLLNSLNSFLFRLQYSYMRPKITTEEVTLHSAFFHPKVRRTPPAR